VSIPGVRVVNLPRIHDPRGNLTFLEGLEHVPFEIRRVYWLYDVPGGESRAGHAMKTTQQLLIAASGSFDVHLDDGSARMKLQLNRSYIGLYVPPMIWRTLDNFSSGAVCLAIVSTHYDPADYHRDYDEFLKAASQTARAKH